MPTLIQDLRPRGLLDETLVVWMGEFGRSPKVTNTKQFGPDGRDHWPMCYTVLFAGGGIDPRARSTAPATGSAPIPATDPVTPDDVAATMFWALGIDPATEVTDTLGRPLPIAAGKPITPSLAERLFHEGWFGNRRVGETHRMPKLLPGGFHPPYNGQSDLDLTSLDSACAWFRERDRTGGRKNDATQQGPRLGGNSPLKP